MGLLVSFFVMLVAFSNQDATMMHAVAGSMREAFGIQDQVRDGGIREVDGLPTRAHLKHAEHIAPENSSVTPSRNEHGSGLRSDNGFALAAASLRQAMEGLPELAEASGHILVEASTDGLNIEVVDQDESAMFAAGSSAPYERLRTLLEKLAGPLQAAKFPVTITGHTAADDAKRSPGHGPWELSLDRANAVRDILAANGLASANIYKVAGAAATAPLLPENITAPPNRRVTITLMNLAPPVPAGLQP
jgi:chemotaxis protein MotB